MYKVEYTNKFLKDLKLIKKRSAKDFALVADFIENELAVKGANGLDKKYKTHKLSGNYSDNWECHIKSDLLIIWIEVTPNMKILLVRLGSHSDLF
ncbi:MAG: type II toxin-antitoxin system mRNA interferase toxin, RelE/StbE family [Legionella sp.]|uniref:type II toxin-antitoxin system RelE/ParE family toxin n=1 Tax=Legionella sp. TaxID=459 RepID=UPI0039E35B1E